MSFNETFMDRKLNVSRPGLQPENFNHENIKDDSYFMRMQSPIGSNYGGDGSGKQQSAVINLWNLNNSEDSDDQRNETSR